MRNNSLVLTILGCLLSISRTHAQQPWQPFRPGLTYQLSELATVGDTTHTLRLGAGAPVAGTPADSVFRFTQRVGRYSGTRNSTANCNAWQWLRADNLFGATLRSQPRAVFVLAAANGRTLTLRPRAPLGQSWATGIAGLTASVTGRAVSSRTLGASPDSVVTITFSDSQTLYLTKSYGFLEGPSLDSYLNGRNVRRRLSLTALPERRLGTAVVGAHATYDYQPGDVFQRVIRFSRGAALCTQTWQQDSVLTRRVSRTGDSITYTISTRQRITPITSSCSTLGGPVVSPATTSTLLVTVTGAANSSVPLLTSTYGGTSLAGDLSSSVSSNSSLWAGRPTYFATFQGLCYAAITTDSAALKGPNITDVEHGARYAVGLGIVYDSARTLAGLQITKLTAFRKGTQTWGTFFTSGTLLAARNVRPATTTTAFPNPFSETLTVSFVLANTQPVGATLYDALGRQVRTVPAASLGAGSRQLALSTAGLPAGVYTVHLHFAGEARSEVLKVVKTL